jgi:glycosyltransferase involved in cell wall biosynthesis
VAPYPPARDGIGAYTSVLAEAVAEHGVEARVLVPRPAAGCPPEVIGALNWRPGRAGAVWQGIARFRPEVVHIQFAVAAYGLRTLALLRWLTVLRRKLGVPVIVTMHEVTRDTALLHAPGRVLYRRICRCSDLVIVHTQAASTVLAGPVLGGRSGGSPPASVMVIPHPAVRPPEGGVAPAELRERFGLSGARIFLAFGFVHVDKGLPDLVRALGLLRRADRSGTADVRVVIAGAVRRRHGPMRIFEVRDHLQLRMALRQARLLDVRDQLILTGYVPDSEVVGWFRAADAAVLPYWRIEESGVAGLAIALDVPVLASQVGGLAEIFGDGQWMFPAHDPAGLAQVMTDFLAARPELRNTARRDRQAADLTAVAAATARAYARTVTATAGGLARVG